MFKKTLIISITALILVVVLMGCNTNKAKTKPPTEEEIIAVLNDGAEDYKVTSFEVLGTVFYQEAESDKLTVTGEATILKDDKEILMPLAIDYALDEQTDKYTVEEIKQG